MNIYQEKNNTIVTGVKDFCLSQTLECGQCFHFLKMGPEEYLISAMNHCIHMEQQKDTLIFYNTKAEEYKSLYEHYFDLKRDYAEIKETLLSKDDKLKEAMDEMWGVRILNQEFFETMISFIISQNQQIPRIKNIVFAMSEKMGQKLCENMYAFPDAGTIVLSGEEAVRECKAGFRSPYIMDACEKYLSDCLDEEKLMNLDYAGCMNSLKEVRGIGEKVANCIALFSLDKRNAFPVDVWIKRIMESLYFGGETSIKEISDFAAQKYGEYGGYAQQYLFHYGRKNNIGKK